MAQRHCGTDGHGPRIPNTMDGVTNHQMAGTMAVLRVV